MPARLSIKPKTQKKIHFLDIFCGDARRLKAMAKKRRWKNKKLVGIELKEPSGIKSRKGKLRRIIGKNLKIFYTEALKKLSKRKSASVENINVDYLLAGVHSNIKVSSGPIDVGGPTHYDKAADERATTTAIIKQIHRVLTPNGSFYVSDYYQNINWIIEQAKRIGFKLKGQQWITRAEQAKTTDLRENLAEIEIHRWARKKWGQPGDGITKLANKIESTHQPVRLVFSKK